MTCHQVGHTFRVLPGMQGPFTAGCPGRGPPSEGQAKRRAASSLTRALGCHTGRGGWAGGCSPRVPSLLGRPRSLEQVVCHFQEITLRACHPARFKASVKCELIVWAVQEEGRPGPAPGGWVRMEAPGPRLRAPTQAPPRPRSRLSFVRPAGSVPSQGTAGEEGQR